MEFDNAVNLDRESGVRGTKKTGRPGFPVRGTTMFACPAFCKESRMAFDNATNLDRKSGGSPTIAFAIAELSAVAPLWESIGNQSSLSQVRWGEGHPVLRLGADLTKGRQQPFLL
jgi:hypothetical protein